MMLHGGEIYDKNVKHDFSVNTNPLGMPGDIKAALTKAIQSVGVYPDYECRRLREHLGRFFDLNPEWVICTSGASEALTALLRCLTGLCALIPVPSFYGYARGALAADMKVSYHMLGEKSDFFLGEDVLAVIPEGGAVILGNPNNPTGRIVKGELMSRLLEECEKRDTYLIVDESFSDFVSGGEVSVADRICENKKTVVIKSFTKLYAAPGVRLGCILTSDEELTGRIKRQLPEWNLSSFALAAGECWGADAGYKADTIKLIRREGEYLAASLSELGLRVYESDAPFVLFKSDRELYEPLLKEGIMIRDCRDTEGLGAGYYRIAVKTRKDNELLVDALRMVLGVGPKEQGFGNDGR